MTYNKKLTNPLFAQLTRLATTDWQDFEHPFAFYRAGVDTAGTPPVYLSDDAREPLEHLASEILRDPYLSEYVGRSAVENAVIDAVHVVSSQRLQSKSAFDALHQAIDAVRSEVAICSVIMPLVNLRALEKVHLGSVDIWTREEGDSHLTRFIGGSLTKTSKRLVSTIVDKCPNRSCWAVCAVHTHPSNSVARGRTMVIRALNVLRAFLPAIDKGLHPRGFGLPFEIRTNTELSYVSTVRDRPHVATDSFGIYYSLDFSSREVAHLNRIAAFDSLCELATSESPLEGFKKSLVVATQWLGRAATAALPVHKFTDYMFALEQLLMAGGGEAISEHIATRAAFLLANTPTARKGIHRAVKDLYQTRSRIVHSGFDTIDQIQLQTLATISVKAVAVASRYLSRVQSHSQFLSILDDRKFGYTDDR